MGTLGPPGPPEQSPHFRIPHFIPPAESLLPWEVTYSRVLGTRTWTYLGPSFCLPHPQRRWTDLTFNTHKTELLVSPPSRTPSVHACSTHSPPAFQPTASPSSQLLRANTLQSPITKSYQAPFQNTDPASDHLCQVQLPPGQATLPLSGAPVWTPWYPRSHPTVCPQPCSQRET